MGLCDRRDKKRADGGLFRQVPGKQKKPGKPIISGFPGIDTKPALRFGRLVLYERLFLNMVEAGGVEPPSENTSSGTSPGADGCFYSRAMPQTVMLHGLVASWVMPGAKLTPVTCTTKIMP